MNYNDLNETFEDFDLEIQPDIPKLDQVKEIEEENTTENIKNFFEIANENVKAATEIFNKSVEMKKKLLEESKKVEAARESHELKTKLEIDRITQYREDLKAKYSKKKEDLEVLEESLNERELNLTTEKKRFEDQKIKDYEILRNQERQQKEFISAKEQSIKKLKEEVDAEKKNLEFEKSKHEIDSKELEENLKKFNELVSHFSSGMEKFNVE